MTKSCKNEEPNKCTINEIMENPDPETGTEPDDNVSAMFYENVRNFITDYRNKRIVDAFYLAVEEYELHYYVATAIRLIMSTRNITVYEESIILNGAIDLLIRWRENVKDNKSIKRSDVSAYPTNEASRFADVAFSDPHDKRHIAIGLIIKATTTSDNDLCDIYLDAAIALLKECIMLGVDRSIERDR